MIENSPLPTVDENPQDLPIVKINVASEGDRVAITFSNPIPAVVFTPENALIFADMIRREAKKLRSDRKRHGKK